jgi:hypothetical protein
LANIGRKRISWIAAILLLLLYAAYLSVVISAPSGPVDFETFRSIGARFLAGADPYGENSYYPMPFVGIFGFLALLPRPVAAVLWLGLPLLAAFAISGWSPLVLVFAPLMAHFTGGQSAVFGLLAVWAIRQRPAAFYTGFLLALATVKPQLAVIPLLWASRVWWIAYRSDRRVPRQFMVFVVSIVVLWLPWFLVRPGWLSEWLSNPRPLFERAMAGILPRTLLLLDIPSPFYWILIFAATALLIWLLRRSLSLDIWLLIWFIVSPLVHDYDLIQLIPLLDTFKKRLIAFLGGIPTLIVMAIAYNNDSAWFACTLIAPVLLMMTYLQVRNRPKIARGLDQKAVPV